MTHRWLRTRMQEHNAGQKGYRATLIGVRDDGGLFYVDTGVQSPSNPERLRKALDGLLEKPSVGIVDLNCYKGMKNWIEEEVK
jgi:hypothetical protein